jgi:tetratricopeptide (TPR) repeat protein
MAVNSKYDFEGGYENDTHGGMLHVASHHFSPGKKQWTWGNGDFGRAWDRNLTDHATGSASDGSPIGTVRSGFRPYIELMAGVYTENQPDFTWLMPYEEKQFVQYFMPYRELGVVKQASKDFILNIEEAGEGSIVTFKVLATSKKEVRIVLRRKDGEEYYNKVVTLSPEEVFEQTVDVKGATLNDLVLNVGRLMWMAEPDEIRPIPDAAEAALSPTDTKTNDQLYLTGLHLEQYRHATWSALDYYEEALRRDPNDVRCLNQTGLWYLRRGRFDKAEPYLRKAVKIWQKRNPNPYEGEAIFNLALCLKYQQRSQEAYELFWKSTWNKAWADAGYFEAACISTSQARYDDALDELNRCLVFNSCNHKARALKAAVLRKLGREDEAQTWIRESLKLDRFNYGCMYEARQLERLQELMHDNVYNYHELALDYAQAGLWQECADILQLAPEGHPMTCYYIGQAQLGIGDAVAANAAFEQAERVDSSYCFPNRLEDVVTLTLAKTMNPDGARAPYYLGCLYYDKRQYDVAIENWELSARLDPTFPTVWRNLALARFNKQNRQQEALDYMERAFHLDETDSRILMELDQLYKRLQKPHQERLDFLQQYPQLIQQRDDLVLEEITLLNQLGRYEEAMQKLDAHQFHPWEGGEGKVPAQYQICRVEMAKQLLKEDPQSAEAKRLLEECLVYPPHLGEGKLYGAQDNDFLYFLGRYEEGTVGPTEPAAAMYYNDAKPDKIFYAGLCYRKLGQEDKARSLFNKLINYGKQHLFEHQTMDYFAVSLPDLLIWEDSLDMKNRIHCLYMLALGYYGMGDQQKARHYMDEVERLDINHYGIQALKGL